MTRRPLASPKITRFARGQECTVRFNPPCDPETVVACHVHPPGHGRVGGKVGDLWTVHACHACHDAIDRRANWNMPAELYWSRLFAAMVETQARLIEAGLLVLK